MAIILLKYIKYFEVFKFSEHESNCLKMPFRSGAKIGYVSVSKDVYYAEPHTLVFRSDEPNKNPLYTIVRL